MARPKQKSDNYHWAKRYYQKNRDTRAFYLSRVFNLSLKSAYRVIEDVEAYHKSKKEPWDIIEDEIKGMDWQYNPERDIQHLSVPKY